MRNSGLADSPFFSIQPATPGNTKETASAEPQPEPPDTTEPTTVQRPDDTIQGGEHDADDAATT
jgi:hypothetical protein